MPKIAGLDLYSTRGQLIVMLLATLKEEGSGSRQETCNRIVNRHWFNIQDEDWPPYQSMPNHEPRWRTVVAWARKDAFDFGYLDDIGHNHWQLSRSGKARLLEMKQSFAEQKNDVSRCYMWRDTLKKYMYGAHRPSERDWQRPATIYQNDLRWERMQHLRRFLLDSL